MTIKFNIRRKDERIASRLLNLVLNLYVQRVYILAISLVTVSRMTMDYSTSRGVLCAWVTLTDKLLSLSACRLKYFVYCHRRLVLILFSLQNSFQLPCLKYTHGRSVCWHRGVFRKHYLCDESPVAV